MIGKNARGLKNNIAIPYILKRKKRAIKGKHCELYHVLGIILEKVLFLEA